MAYKKLIYSDYIKQFGGINRLRFDVEKHGVTYGHGFMPLEYQVECMYDKTKNCTYIAMIILGYVNFGGPHDSSSCIVAKFPGKTELIKKDDLTILEPYLEELEIEYRNKDEES